MRAIFGPQVGGGKAATLKVPEADYGLLNEERLKEFKQLETRQKQIKALVFRDKIDKTAFFEMLWDIFSYKAPYLCKTWFSC